MAGPFELVEDDVRVGSLPGVFRRWREARVRGSRGSSVRLRATHRHTRETLKLSLAFAVAAVVAVAAGTERWLPLHLFLAGAFGLVVSGLTLMLTVTWAAAPAPPDRWVAAQRALVALGAAGVAAARVAEAPAGLVGLAGVAYLLGLALLAVLLVLTVIDGLERRFDAAVAGYLCALVLAVAAVGVGVDMAVHEANPELRAVHVVLNLLGFAGLTILATLPFLGATVSRSSPSARVTPIRLAVVWVIQVAAILSVVFGVLTNLSTPVLVGLGTYGYGIIVTLAFMPKVSSRTLNWAGPRLVALWCGALWLAIAVFASAYDVIDRDELPFSGRWLLVAVVGGVAQVIWGVLAYLIPLLRGGGRRKLSEGFGTTRSWLGFAAVNFGAAALTVDLYRAAAAALSLWLADGAWRIARVGLSRIPRADEDLDLN